MNVVRYTSREWYIKNPILADGGVGYDKTLNQIKIGDGRTSWNDLPYVRGSNKAASSDSLVLDGGAP
jgi:hypothetical protein